MAQQQQPALNLAAPAAHPAAAAAAAPHPRGRENRPPNPRPSTPPPPSLVPRPTLGNHNGYLTQHTIYRPPLNADHAETVSDWPFRGLEGPPLRTRIEGNDELVFGAF